YYTHEEETIMSGLKLIRGGKTAQAVELKEAEESAKSLFLEGLSAERSGNKAKAIELYKRSVAKEPGSEDAKFSLNNLGVIHSQQREFKEAGFVFGQVVEIDPYYPLGLYNYATTLDELVKPGDAVGYYLRALAVKPDY